MVGQKLGVSVPLLACPLRRDHPGYCTAEFGIPEGTYELPCICVCVCVCARARHPQNSIFFVNCPSHVAIVFNISSSLLQDEWP
jgi:hypothetical protein